MYGTLYSTFTKYVVLSRCYGVTKARPCTGRTLYKCLHTSLNLGKHINFFSSSRSCLLVSVYFSFYFLSFYFSSTFGLMTKCTNTVCTDGEHTQASDLLLFSRSQRAQYNVHIKQLYEPPDLLGSYDLVLSTLIFDCYSRSGPTRTCQTRTRCNTWCRVQSQVIYFIHRFLSIRAGQPSSTCDFAQWSDSSLSRTHQVSNTWCRVQS